MSIKPTLLECVDSTVLPKLGTALWDWRLCTDCADAKATCQSEACPSSRADKLQRYLQFYRAVVTAYVGESSTASRLLKTHEDLFDCVSKLKSNPEATHTEFHRLCFPVGQGVSPHDSVELRNATSLVVKAMVMIESSALHHESSGRLEKGSFRTPWRDHIAFSTYLEQLFPTTNHPVLSYFDSELFLDIKSELRATKLKKRLGVSFRPTHDIRSHLFFDREANVIEIFHHTAFLKEQLRATKSGGDFSTPSSSIKVGSLPRQLVLEVLDSIQTVLFPLSEPKSKRLLQSLVDKCSLDPDIVNFEYSSIRSIGEENIPYVYLADRLSDLYNEVRNPRPRGWLERQMERKSGARYMMMATLIGVMFAVFLGILSLAVSSFQTWIAYQAWKFPVTATAQ